MKKKLKRLTIRQLPEPFKTYWLSDDMLPRPYTFYDVEGELYIRDGKDWLLHHWTQDSCAGIDCFRMDHHIKENRTAPYVTIDGIYLFEVIPTNDYETSLRWGNKLTVVHSG